MLYREEQERKHVPRQKSQCILRKPDRVRKPDDHIFALRNKRLRAKNSIAQPRWTRLDDIGKRNPSNVAAVIFQNIRFARGDNKTDLISSPVDHPFNEIFADGPGAFGSSVEPAADGEEFFRKGQWLDSAAGPRCW